MGPRVETHRKEGVDRSEYKAMEICIHRIAFKKDVRYVGSRKKRKITGFLLHPADSTLVAQGSPLPKVPLLLRGLLT